MDPLWCRMCRWRRRIAVGERLMVSVVGRHDFMHHVRQADEGMNNAGHEFVIRL